jgi:hypothetical protein
MATNINWGDLDDGPDGKALGRPVIQIGVAMSRFEYLADLQPCVIAMQSSTECLL